MVLRSPLVLSSVRQHRLRHQQRLSRSAKYVAPKGSIQRFDIAFRSKVSATSTATTSHVQNVPAGVVNGDLLFWFLSLDSSQTTAAPAGWNPLVGPIGFNGGTVYRGYIFYRNANAEPASYTATSASAANWTSTMCAYKGVALQPGPFTTFNDTTYGSASSYATPTFFVPNPTIAISFICTERASAPQISVFNPSIGFTERDAVVGTTMAVEVSDKHIPAGSNPAYSTSFNLSSDLGIAFDIGLRPLIRRSSKIKSAIQAVARSYYKSRAPRSSTKLRPSFWHLDVFLPVTGLQATGQVGALAFAFDMNFVLPRGLYRLNPARMVLGFPSVRVDSNPTVAGVQGVGIVGAVVYRSSVSPAGLTATGALGSITTRTDFSFPAVGFAALGRVGTLGFKNAYAIAGVQGAGAVGAPTVLVPNIFVGPSVAGAGQVGVVGFRIDCTVSPIGVFGTMILGSVAERVDSHPAPTGLAAVGQVGSTAYEVRYGVAGVQGAGQVGIPSPTYGVPVAGVRAVGQVGVVRVGFDTTVAVTGVYGTGIVGQQEVPLRLIKVKADKMIYTRAPHS